MSASDIFELGAEFTRREIAPHLDAWEDEQSIPRELHATAAKQGVLGIGFDEAVGGEGGTLLDTLDLQEGMTSAGASSGLLAGLFTHGIALPHIVSSGDRDLVDRFVRPTLAGETIGSLAVTEPGGGSDVAGIRTTAVREGGRVRRQRGQDVHHLGGAGRLRDDRRAHRRTRPRRHQPAGDREGHARLHRGPDPAQDGLALLRHRRARLRRRARAGGQPGRGRERRLLPDRRAVSSSSGSAWPCTPTASPHVRSTSPPPTPARRETFGKPLVANQVVRHKLVEMRRQVESARVYARHVAERHVAGEQVIAEACLAKQTACDAATYVCDQAVQLHGGTGYLHGTEVERHYRDVRILPIGGGATEVLADLAAKLLGYGS